MLKLACTWDEDEAAQTWRRKLIIKIKGCFCTDPKVSWKKKQIQQSRIMTLIFKLQTWKLAEELGRLAKKDVKICIHYLDSFCIVFISSSQVVCPHNKVDATLKKLPISKLKLLPIFHPLNRNIRFGDFTFKNSSFLLHHFNVFDVFSKFNMAG